MTVQFVEIAGQKIAVLPAADYERLVDAAEDRADGEAARRAEARQLAGEEYLPSALVDRLIAGESPLKVWREHRGFSGVSLATASGVHPTTISKLESGLRFGKPAVWQALAKALNVAAADLMPVS